MDAIKKLKHEDRRRFEKQFSVGWQRGGDLGFKEKTNIIIANLVRRILTRPFKR